MTSGNTLSPTEFTQLAFIHSPELRGAMVHLWFIQMEHSAWENLAAEHMDTDSDYQLEN